MTNDVRAVAYKARVVQKRDPLRAAQLLHAGRLIRSKTQRGKQLTALLTLPHHVRSLPLTPTLRSEPERRMAQSCSTPDQMNGASSQRPIGKKGINPFPAGSISRMASHARRFLFMSDGP